VAITDIPLRIKNSNGDLQQFSTSEENFLAYQMGLNLASRGVNASSALSTSSDSAALVGSFTDTQYNQIGVSGDNGTTVEAQETISYLYQKTGAAPIDGTDYETPIGYKTSDTSIREMVDSDLFGLVDRTLSVWATNDYPGIYKLDSSGFSDGDYEIHIDTVFEDNRSNVNNLQTDYHIWKRTSMTPPSAARPMFVVRTGGGEFAGGVREMTDTQIQYTFGQRARNRIISSGIGTYQLRDNTQGAPTDPGTWVAKGVATDTRHVIVETQFSDTYESTSEIPYSAQVDRTYTGNYESQYSKQYGAQYARQYTRQYAGLEGYTTLLQYSKGYTAQYTRQFAGGLNTYYTGLVSFEGTAQYTRQYSGFIIGPSFDGTYVGAFTGTFGGGTYTGVYSRQRAYVAPAATGGGGEFFIGIYESYASFTGQFTGAAYQGQYSSSFIGTYVLDVENQFTGTYQRSAIYSSQEQYLGVLEIQYSNNYASRYVRQYTGSTTYTGTRQYAGQYSSQYTQQYTAQFAAQFAGSYTGQFGEIYVKQYVGDQYIAQYGGQVVDDTQSTVIKTYTLYVRTA